MQSTLTNKNKNLVINVGNSSYGRIPIKTKIITDNDNIYEIVNEYIKHLLQPGDIVFIAESIVAITQKRAIKLTDIKPRKLARFLSTKVSHNPGGVGLTCPEMMEMAFREAGTLRMLMAAAASVIGKLLGKKGWFYIVAGSKVRDIDGPDEYTIAPFNEYVVLAPENPDKVANDIRKVIGNEIAIVDVNDLGANILGNATDYSNELICQILEDNPLGQTSEQTPIGIIRKIK